MARLTVRLLTIGAVVVPCLLALSDPRRQMPVGDKPKVNAANCTEKRTYKQLAKAIQTVLDRQRQVTNGDIDGYCYFGAEATWLRACASARANMDYLSYARSKSKKYEIATPRIDTNGFAINPLVVKYGEGTRALRTYLISYPLEDVYCEVNGFMDLPVKNLHNHTMWTELAKEECNKLFMEYPEYTFDSMAGELELLELNAKQLQDSAKGMGGGPPLKDMKRHAIAKCLLGGLECDMANCASNFCRRDDWDMIGHGDKQCQTVRKQF